MRQLSGLLFGMALLGLVQSSVHGQAKKEEPKSKVELAPAPSLKHLDGRKIVFVANGAGGSTSASDNLFDVNSDKNLGLIIKPIAWTRQDSAKGDVLDQDAQLCAAAKI